MPLVAFWSAAGAMHFIKPRFYEAIMPDYLPAHRELVYASGVAELAGAAALVPARTRRAGGWWLLAVLAAVYPANVHMALNPDRYDIPEAALWGRLPLQFVAAYWVWRVAIRPR